MPEEDRLGWGVVPQGPCPSEEPFHAKAFHEGRNCDNEKKNPYYPESQLTIGDVFWR
jgi:hypothetical protein